MAFPPGFLDELRARVPLGSLVGRRVRLIRKGRELAGLCPFHHEKTPSFYVVEDKNFFHCFGCGAHGDAIGYLMRAENLDFIEAIERLAAEAGLAVPQQTPQERERAQRQKTLLEALAAAAEFYEKRLWSPAGARARDYLVARGLDEETIRRFRLGWASDDRQALRRALPGDFPEALLIEGGLLRRPEGGGEPYDYFRGRILFPIGDRAGRVIAFGGRTMGASGPNEGQPKYLNSPDTPLFEKGRVLYAWAAARANLARSEAGEAASVIVVEGYMDVIALHRAGFGTAVAPLGTALTEAHLGELWRLSPEPVLCFDGDMAGQRAMLRALHRALPLLQPGRSLPFAVLPSGEDPDSLVRDRGKPAFAEILAAARPLSEMLWQSELAARPIDTPERRADLERRLMADAALIADRTVQAEYRRFFRERLFALGRSAAARGAWSKGRTISGPGAARAAIPGSPLAGEAPPPPPRSPALLRREILMRMLLQHPFLVNEATEEIASIDLPEPELDRLRREILQVEVLQPGLDASGLRQHLERCGFGSILDGLLSPSLDHAGFLSSEGDDDAVRQGWLHVLRMTREELRSERASAAEALARDPSDATWERFLALHGRQTEEDVATAELLAGGAKEQDPR
ncbi:MAG: DNA primase [Alphaproteobacteria bacterium]|nr:DNA primase [Alphaproteobacteria bacterium]MBV9967144.1 DNA primase [Alphaproteobacteria bacterium]